MVLRGRQHVLKLLFKSYQECKIPLIIKSAHNISANCILNDDPGMFLYAPFIASYFNIPVLKAAQFFFWAIASVFYITSLMGVFDCKKSFLPQFFSSIIFTCFFYKLCKVTDLYIAYVLPFTFTLLILKKLKKSFSYPLYILTFFSGVLCSMAAFIRLYSDLPAIILYSICLLFSKAENYKKKLFIILLFIVGYSIPILHFHNALRVKRDYLVEHNITPTEETIYGFWHNLYMGFGFTQNNHNITVHDACSLAAARQVKPGIVEANREYEALLKNLTWELFKKDRHFVLTSFFARFGIVVMFFLLWFGWVGVLIRYFYPKPWYEDFAFFAAMAISAAPGILTIPCSEYLIGFIACTVLYTTYTLLNINAYTNKKI